VTGADYLERLQAALAAFEPGEREDFLREMESHIEDLCARHPEEDEENLVSGLTPPERLAEELLGPGSPGRVGRTEAGGSSKDGGSQEGTKAGGDSRLDRGSRGPAEKLRAAFEAIASLGLFSEEGRRRSGAAEIRLDFGHDHGQFLRDFPSEGLVDVEVRLGSADLLVCQGVEGKIQVAASGEDPGSALTFTVSEGRLCIEEAEGRGEGLDEIRLELPAGLSLVELSSRSGDVDCEDLDAELSIETVSGDLRLRGLQAACRVQTASGDIDASGCASMSVTSASGDIALEDFDGDVIAEAASGDIDIEGVRGSAAVKSASGDLGIRDVAERVAARSASGSVEIGDCAGPIGIISTSGEVEVDVSGGFGGLTVSTVSGDISVTLPDEPDALVKAQSKSGEVRIGDREGAGSDLVLGSGGSELLLSSLSGDIDVDW
jgi:hypothetical protein